MNRQITVLLQMEVKELFAQQRIFHFLPLLVAGMFFISWIYHVGSPLAPIIVIVVAGLEPQFNNILFRSPNELQALGVFPCQWRDVIFAKNLAALLLFILFLFLTSMNLLYFSPETITAGHLESGVLYILTVVFPLLHTGNTQSLRRPRMHSGLLLEDLVQAIWMCVNLLLLSVPFFVLSLFPYMWISCLVYCALSGFVWYEFSLKRSAAILSEQFQELCLRV